MHKYHKQLKNIILSGIFFLVFCATAQAARVQPLAAQVDALSQQVQQLQAELMQLKHGVRHPAHRPRTHKKPAEPTSATPALKGSKRLHFRKMTVVTSPFLGLRSMYDASDLLVSAPSINEDLVLLKQRSALADSGYQITSPVLELGGKVESVLNMGGATATGKGSALDIGSAAIDANAIASQWVNAMMTLSYADDILYGYPTDESLNPHVYFERAFLTVGNLRVTPFYFTAGLGYVPFGNYAGATISSPLTEIIARTNALMAVVGYADPMFNIQAYVFNPDALARLGRTRLSTSPNSIGNGGVNLTLTPQWAGATQTFTVGYVNNIGDAVSLVNEHIDILNPAGLAHAIPAVDLQANLKYRGWNVIAEYIQALRHYQLTDFRDFSVVPNAHTTIDFQNTNKPSALDVMLGYAFHWGIHPWNIYLHYGHTHGADLPYRLPQNVYGVVMNASWFKNSVISLELRKDDNYPNETAASMSAMLQFGVYF